MIRLMGKIVPAALFCMALAAGCTAKQTVVEDADFDFDGTCVRCHNGLRATQVHPTFKLRCVDCHGGNDQVFDVPADAFEDVDDFRDPDLILASHQLLDDRVLFKDPALARFFIANSIDEDGDMIFDEAPEFGAGDLVPNDGDQIVNTPEIAEFFIQGEGIGQFIDAEYNRDLNYTRWLNPGDLRVATVSCGAGSATGLREGTACHQTVVEQMRRSIMTNQAAVINGAYYGNESFRPEFIDARDSEGEAPDPRNGAFGYTLDYTLADGCIVAPDADELVDPALQRIQSSFDSACLEEAVADSAVANNFEGVVAGDVGNVGLPTFEILEGTVAALDLALLEQQLKERTGQDLLIPDRNFDFVLSEGFTIRHQPARDSRFEWGGNPVRDVNAILPELEPVPNVEINVGGLVVEDPVDLVLRGFRAYYPLNYQGSAINFNFTFGESILPNVAIIKTNNPFGRGHSTGCTSCHMKYNFSGARDAQLVKVFDEEGNFVADELIEDPTTKHREFDPANQDIVNINGQERLVGVTVTANQRDVDKDGVIDDGNPLNGGDGVGNGLDREQQRYYSADHRLTTQIDTDMCGSCHTFVTRINLAYQGTAEDEQRDALSRIEPIEFETPQGTDVIIHSSLVREENGVLINEDDARAVIQDAIQRDEMLAGLGLIPGAGGCAAATFTEDCNNNGELDQNIELVRLNEDGSVFVSFRLASEDTNGNGKLDLIDRIPREISTDGRQMRYVYGGANGSTRQMDVHFERGMHCIDCHMIQDTHGDGNIYSTNWDQIEIECDDCHGTLDEAPLTTSGANGLNDLTKAIGLDGRPFFERQDGKIIQRSRVTPGLFWVVPETIASTDPDDPTFNAEAAEAHNADHLPDSPGRFAHENGSIFAGEGVPGRDPLEDGKLECYACHMSWVHNCMGCHYGANALDTQSLEADAAGNIAFAAGENETWFSNVKQEAITNFQLLEFMRAPFVLGTNASADGGRIGTFRSSMQLHVSVNDGNGDAILDSTTFTTHIDIDGNTGRENVATSGAVLNQTMAHTVRPIETKSCEQCHKLVNDDDEVLNDHILAETFGIGAGRYAYLGDWAFAVGGGGLELFEYKDDRQLIVNQANNNSNRFPGIILDGSNGDRVAANVEPLFAAGDVLNDVVFIRNFNAEPVAAGQVQAPTLQDVAVSVGVVGGVNRLVVSEVTFRGNPNLANRPAAANNNQVFLLNLPDTGRAVAHIAPDVSDPFVYVAADGAGLVTVKLLDEPGQGNAAMQVDADAPQNGNATEVMLAGDFAYVGTDAGTIETFDLANPANPQRVAVLNLGQQVEVRAITLAGFFMYAGTTGGLAVIDISDLEAPDLVDGLKLTQFDMQGAFFYSGKLFVAARGDGVREIDVTNPAQPVDRGDDLAVLLGGQAPGSVNVVDVVVSKVPVQTWILALENDGDLVGIKFDDNIISIREKCFRGGEVDPACGLDMDFRDMTIMGRDPTVLNPRAVVGGATPQFDGNDPSGIPFFRQTRALLNAGQRLALPAYWEKTNTHSGRRYRDSFMPGTGVLSRDVMKRMYDVPICIDQNSVDINGNGLPGVGRADLGDGECFALQDLSAADYFALIGQRTGQRDGKAGGETKVKRRDRAATRAMARRGSRVSTACSTAAAADEEFGFGTDEELQRACGR